jgi:ferredoxin
MTRFEELKQILAQGRFFKMVCAAGNEDAREVKNLALVYTLAGANGFDVSARVEVVQATVQGIDRAFALAGKLGAAIPHRPFITVSVGLKGDPHMRKARILKEVCTECGECRAVCEQEAIGDPIEVNDIRCIGCGACAEVCPADAVEFYTRKAKIERLLPDCLDAGAENIELHATVIDDAAVLRDWRYIAALLPNQFISMCLDRARLSDEHLLRRIRQAKEVAGDRLIIQADGRAMSGSEDDYYTTLQAVAIAQLVQLYRIPLMLLASGGTNSRTGELARQCGVKLNGVSLGTFARKLIREEIKQPNFTEDLPLIAQAADKVRGLVTANLNAMAWW